MPDSPVRPAVASLLAALALIPAPPAHADICKYIDAEGRIIYSNVEIRDARKIDCSIVSEETLKKPPAAAPGAAPAAAAKQPAPANFPKVDATTQRKRDDERRKVLADELAIEEKLLAEARAQYANGAPAPLPEERTQPQKYSERVARLRQSVQVHERNVDALRKEMGKTR
jgi:hypothetical protein